MMEQTTFRAQAKVDAERRSAHRTRMFKGAVMRFNNGYSAMEAIIRNMTDKGAMLQLGDAAGVPSAFSLEIKGENGIRQARVVWRDSTRVGVRFE